jgi:hypothetical protein
MLTTLPYFNGLIDINEISAIYLGENATSYHTVISFKHSTTSIAIAYSTDKDVAQQRLDKIIQLIKEIQNG